MAFYNSKIQESHESRSALIENTIHGFSWNRILTKDGHKETADVCKRQALSRKAFLGISFSGLWVESIEK